MNQIFQITKTVFLVLTILICLAIPVVSLIVTAYNWNGGCFFGEYCSWWEYAGIAMSFIAIPFIPFLVATSFVWIVMSVVQSSSKDSRKSKWIRTTLLILVFLIFPFLISPMLNLNKDKLRVKNNTPQILYLTVVKTNWYDDSPSVISQNIAFRKHNIPVRPQTTVTLQFGAGDAPLAGIAVCRTEADCRLLPISYLHDYELNSYESLKRLNPSWLTAIQSSPLYNYSNLITIPLSLVPILLLSRWLYLNRSQ